MTAPPQLLAAMSRLCLSFALGALLLACTQQVSKADFDRVQSNMSFEQVVAILGNPEDLSSISLGPLGGLGGLESAEAVWATAGSRAYVRFVNGRVTVKTWQPADR